MPTLLNKFRVVNIPDGSSNLTRANFVGLTPAGLEAMATTEYNKARMYAEAAEAIAVGVTPKSIDELLMGRITEIGKAALNERKVMGSGSIILPYGLRRRKNNMPNPDFNVTAGVSDTSVTTHGWKITVKFSPKWLAAWGGASPQYLARFFLKGEYIYITGVNTAGVAGTDRDVRCTAFKVVSSTNIDADSAYVLLEPCVTTTAWAGYTAAQKLVHQPTHGIIAMGTNNVADEEAWAFNQPSDLTGSVIVDWQQTSRYTQCYNDVYADTLAKVLKGEINDFQKAFANLPLAEQNKQQAALYRKKFLHSVFFGQPVNENQTPETVTSLPQVVDPENGTVYGYKANALGLRTLLSNESQIIDCHAGALDLKVVIDASWKIKRNREAQGESHDVICWMTDKDTAANIDIQLLGALKTYFGESITRFYDAGQIRTTEGETRWTYKKYDLPGCDFQLAIIVENYLTDRLFHYQKGTGGAEGAVDFQHAGRALWAIDWNDFSVGIISSNSAKREFKGEAYSNVNELFATVITPNTKHYDLRSTTWTTQLGDAKRSLMIENFSSISNLTL